MHEMYLLVSAIVLWNSEYLIHELSLHYAYRFCKLGSDTAGARQQTQRVYGWMSRI